MVKDQSRYFYFVEISRQQQLHYWASRWQGEGAFM